MLQVYGALIRGVVLESVRRKDLWVVAILGLLIVMCAGALGFFGLQGLELFAKDLAFSVLGGLSAVIAIVTTARQVPDEIKNRTLYPILARPITRFDYLIGKLLGTIAVTWIGFFALASLTACALAVFGVTFEPIMLQYVVFKLMGLALLCSVTMALSVCLTPQAAVTLSFILAFGSGMISRALVLGYGTATPSAQGVMKAVNAMIPQFGLFDLGARAANLNWSPAPLWVGFALLGYLLLYGASITTIGWLKFRNRAI